MVRPGYERTEADVRYQLISPLLKRVAHSMSFLVPPASNEDQDDDPVYASSLTVEKATERRIHIPGAKPRVDYCFVGYKGDEILYTIAVETKKSNLRQHKAISSLYGLPGWGWREGECGDWYPH